MELLSLVEDGQTALSTATHAALEANGIRFLPSHVERIAAAKRNALAETDRIELRPDGTVRGGPVTLTNARAQQARQTLLHLFGKLAALHTGNDNASLSRSEATQLAASLSYMLGLDGLPDEQAIDLLCSANPDALFQQAQTRLAEKTSTALQTWQHVVALMPPIRNVALRDTLASIGQLRRSYDTYLAAHEVPCHIDYPLSQPIDEHLQGVDYVQAWLDQLLSETRWLAQFTPESCITALERACPDYRGLHVNLYDLLKPRESKPVKA